MIETTLGALVRYGERERVVLPSGDLNLVLLRPISGSSREVCGVVKPLADLMGYEALSGAPNRPSSCCRRPEDVQDHVTVWGRRPFVDGRRITNLLDGLWLLQQDEWDSTHTCGCADGCDVGSWLYSITPQHLRSPRECLGHGFSRINTDRDQK